MMALSALSHLVAKGEAGDTALGKILLRGPPIFFDGLLLGTFLVTGIGAFVMTFALSIEQFFVGMAVAAALERLGRTGLPLFGLILVCAVLFAFGVLLGGSIVGSLGEMNVDRVIGMATAIMLYVVVEEMLRDAHAEETPDSPFVRSAFFAGFILTLFLE